MKLGILSRGPGLYSTRRLVEAAQQRGHEVQVIDYLRCYMDISSRHPQVLYRGESLDLDAVVPRIASRRTFYGTSVVRQFEMMGVYTANESQAISRSRDKLCNNTYGLYGPVIKYWSTGSKCQLSEQYI